MPDYSRAGKPGWSPLASQPGRRQVRCAAALTGRSSAIRLLPALRAALLLRPLLLLFLFVSRFFLRTSPPVYFGVAHESFVREVCARYIKLWQVIVFRPFVSFRSGGEKKKSWGNEWIEGRRGTRALLSLGGLDWRVYAGALV